MSLAADVWAYMAFNDDRPPVQAAYGMPTVVRRDIHPRCCPTVFSILMDGCPSAR